MSEAAEASKKSSEEADRLKTEQTSASQVATTSLALVETAGK